MAGLRAPKAGSNREVQGKVDASFEPEDARKCLDWIKAVTGQNFNADLPGERYKAAERFYHILKDGNLLCLLVNAFLPDGMKLNLSSKTFQQTSNMAFQAARERERIEIFTTKIQDFGVPEVDAFPIDNLYERTNLNKVVAAIRSFGIEVESHPSYTGNRIWPHKSEPTPRHFTEEQLRASNNHISLQYGTNKGASQAGMNFGKKRMILKE